MHQILETDRLILRQFTTADTAFIIELLNSPGWLKFIGDRQVRTTEEATNYLLNGPIKSYHEHGFGLSLVAAKTSNTPIGMCGILKRANLQLPDIGFALLPQFEGQGYAFEMASAVVTHAKEIWNVSEICAIVMPSNPGSISLIEKLGFKKRESFISDNTNEVLFLYTQ